MKNVAKYNLFKAISTVLTTGTPIVTLAFCSDFFVHNSTTSISAAGVFAILIAALFLKDKLAENFKLTSSFTISTIIFVFILLIENILTPIKYVCLATMIASGVDELTFKRFYKVIETKFPIDVNPLKFAGFIATTSKSIYGMENKVIK